jgi:putative selenium metabolism protein SsnA
MPYDLAPPDDFLQILQRIWWRLDRALDTDLIRASALVGGLEALLSGTTTLVDHHASPNEIGGSLDVVAEALEELGVRSLLCYETSDRDGPERALAGIDENRRFVGRISAEKPALTRGLVGAHASFTLSDDTLAACAEAARSLEVGLHVHAAEDALDESDSEHFHGQRVTARLAHAGALDGRTLLAHGVHFDEHEIALVQASNAFVAHNARSNMNNAVGRAAVEALGIRLALGTDGIGSDMFEESRAAFFRLREDDVHAGAEWSLDRLAAGARFVGSAFGERKLGKLETGAPADLVVLDYAAPAPVTTGTFAGHWIFGLASRHVRDVMVGGEWVVLDRVPTRVDPQEVAARARSEVERLWKRLDDVPEHEFTPRGGHRWPSQLTSA